MARKILLADDSVTAQNMGRKILADAGYEVITVNNGSAALKKIAEIKPDLVILDVYMPGYSGLEVCQRLKESQDSARIPVLLTVGKLEPFKPEEAQRVRAEGFIVKPFEASELLSTLSKLEDKVVPRAEPSKPGRFARAIAAVEEAGRGSRGEASGEDNGWKSRISFPHQKAESEEKDKDADTAAFYNPINRDLRTVVESPAELAAGKAAELEEKLHQAHKASQPSVDVAALVPPGLPQDVTPEEVAAIAAAAAQIQMLGAVVKDDLKATPERVEEKEERREPIPAQPGVSVSAPTASAEMAQESPGSENTRENDKNDKSSEDSRDLPVTMAAAAEAPGPASENGSRWTAVPIALEGAEATLSLDQEMQKACAAITAEAAASAAMLPEPASQNSFVPAEPGFPVVAVANPEPEFAAQSQPVITAEVAQTESAATPAVASSVSAESLPEAELVAPVLAPAPPPETPSEEAPFEGAHSEPALLAESTPASQEPAVDAVSSIADTADANLAPPSPQESRPAPDAESSVPVPEPAAPSHALASFTPSPHAEEQQDYKEDHQAESETVKSTAAAWANWRQIRDAGETRHGVPESSHPESEESLPVSAEAVAMAVAAGAEHAAQENPAPASENPADIAGIVDSVLADLRPRLMAEISKKMSEKK